jgi:pimeloyl-ACP methyl ester carboxylesterase
LVFVLAIGCALFADRLAAEAQQPMLAWAPCGGAFECATLNVPLDYANPDARSIELALVRQPARDPSRRIGALLLNPGGPGASGLDITRALAPWLADEIRQRFDIVGFDPRGVGQSTPLLCHDDVQRLGGLEPEPDSADEWADVIRVNREFAELCARRGGDLLPHLGSLNVVRDMDRIREALGDEQISYLGYSYGTVLGALYADQFPERLRAAVLDGAVDIGLPAEELMAVQAVGFERVFERFVADCKQRGCALGDDPAAEVDRVLERSRERPIPAANADRPAGPGEVQLGIVQSLYRPQLWPTLERAIAAARDGDATTLVGLADLYLGRRGGTYDNSYAANAAVNCLDYAFPRDIERYQTTLAAALEQRAPRFGRAFAASAIPCALWPAPPQPIALTNADDTAPLLVIGTTHDPATPFAWALGLRADLPDSLLLTHEGDGHTIYGLGNRCVDSTVNTYLLTLSVPQDGAICGATDGMPRTPPTPPAAAVATADPGPGIRAPEQAEDQGRRGGARLSLVWLAVALTLVAVVVAFALWLPRRRASGR